MVLYGDGEDSVLILGNPLTPEVMSRRVRSTLIATNATNQRTNIENLSISVMSANTLEMEEQLGKLEGNLQKGFQSQMDSFFERMQSLQNKPQPPGGELAGGVND